MVRGETQYNRISRFVSEIPPELLDTDSRKRTYFTEDDGTDSNSAGNSLFPDGRSAAAGSSRSKSYASKKPFSALTKGSQLTAQKSDSLAYGVGDRVRHVKFGEGTVLDIKEGGRDFEVTVEFDTAGVRKMFAMFAKLAKI